MDRDQTKKVDICKKLEEKELRRLPLGAREDRVQLREDDSGGSCCGSRCVLWLFDVSGKSSMAGTKELGLNASRDWLVSDLSETRDQLF